MSTRTTSEVLRRQGKERRTRFDRPTRTNEGHDQYWRETRASVCLPARTQAWAWLDANIHVSRVSSSRCEVPKSAPQLDAETTLNVHVRKPRVSLDLVNSWTVPRVLVEQLREY